jgi:enterochelin esterase-like enzyme
MRLAEPPAHFREIRTALRRIGIPLPRIGIQLRQIGTRRALIGAAALVFVVIGLLGAGSYWESYYQHRGFIPPARVPQARIGHLETVQFYSRALRRRAQYLVYLPPDYSPARRYPVLYLLHGSPGRPQLFFDVANVGIRLDNLDARQAMPQMILVAPDGRIRGSQFSDSEWANTRSGRFESYVVETVHDVDSRFATIPDREARVIAGYSEGAYGALNIALHQLGVFASVEVWSGYYDQPHPAGPFARASRATLAYNSPKDFLSRVAPLIERMGLRVFIYGGRSDPASTLIRPMVRRLRAHGVSANYAIYRGRHDWQLWNAHLDRMLILAGGDVWQALALAPRFALPPRTVPAPAPSPRVRSHPVVRDGGRGGTGIGEMLAGLLLALLSAAAINLGFLLQHRGLSSARSLPGRGLQLVRAMVHNRSWLGGQALGWAGFATQILAVTIAPLSLVQSFAAGGLALSVPLAARLFGHEIPSRQRVAVFLVAVALAVLPIGLAVHGDRLAGDRLTITSAVVLAAAIGIGAIGTAPMRAIAAGLLYGVADAAIKAVSVGWGAHGAGALLSGWTVLAVLATFAGFLSFQAALRVGRPVPAISLMNCLATLVALVGGVVAFGESLGTGPGAWVLHLLAIALVLACVPVLAAAQAELADSAQQRGSPRALGGAGPRGLVPTMWPGQEAPSIWSPDAFREAPREGSFTTTLPCEGQGGEQRANGEQRCLEPRAEPGAVREDGVAEAHVTRS